MNDTTSDGAGELPLKKDDTLLATIILAVAVVLVIMIGLYLWKSKKIFSGSDKSWRKSAFTPPAERGEYIAAKERLDTSKVSDVDELKKFLMRRAIQTIPILLSLQDNGSSIERLYKRGMLTDDMHYQVKELKAFVDQEFQDVQCEAEDLLAGWGANIWPQAMQFHKIIQQQSESKNEEQRKAEEEKKKQLVDKKREKEKAKKAKKSSSSNQMSTSASVDADDSPAAVSPVITEMDPEKAKIQEAERMAKLLLEEEEREKTKQQKNGNNKKGKK